MSLGTLSVAMRGMPNSEACKDYILLAAVITVKVNYITMN